MKKVLHITAHLGGGAGKAISGVLKYLNQYENTVLLLDEPTETKYVECCKSNGINIIVANDIERINALIKQTDVVVLNWWCHPLFVNVFKALKNTETRVVLWSHINGLFYPYLPFDFLNLFEKVMVTSPCVFDNTYWSEGQKAILKDKTQIVYGMGEFLPEKNPYKRDYSIKEKCNICYTGTLNYSKLNPDFPEICKKIKESVKNAEFQLYGRADEDFKDSYNTDYVTFKGFVTNIEEKIVNADLFCYPLTKENYATTENSLLEAMAAALPIVVLNNPAERNIIIHNETGLVADSIEEFIDFSVRLCNDSELRKRLGENARQSVIQKYSCEVNVLRFASSIEEILKEQKKITDYEKLVGNTAWEFFKFFCGEDLKLINDILDGKSLKLPAIYHSETKSSVFHFLRYFDDENLKELKQKM